MTSHRDCQPSRSDQDSLTDQGENLLRYPSVHQQAPSGNDDDPRVPPGRPPLAAQRQPTFRETTKAFIIDSSHPNANYQRMAAGCGNLLDRSGSHSFDGPTDGCSRGRSRHPRGIVARRHHLTRLNKFHICAILNRPQVSRQLRTCFTRLIRAVAYDRVVPQAN
jgi:hypothetical protein